MSRGEDAPEVVPLGGVGLPYIKQAPIQSRYGNDLYYSNVKEVEFQFAKGTLHVALYPSPSGILLHITDNSQGSAARALTNGMYPGAAALAATPCLLALSSVGSLCCSDTSFGCPHMELVLQPAVQTLIKDIQQSPLAVESGVPLTHFWLKEVADPTLPKALTPQHYLCFVQKSSAPHYTIHYYCNGAFVQARGSKAGCTTCKLKNCAVPLLLANTPLPTAFLDTFLEASALWTPLSYAAHLTSTPPSSRAREDYIEVVAYHDLPQGVRITAKLSTAVVAGSGFYGNSTATHTTNVPWASFRTSDLATLTVEELPEHTYRLLLTLSDNGLAAPYLRSPVAVLDDVDLYYNSCLCDRFLKNAECAHITIARRIAPELFQRDLEKAYNQLRVRYALHCPGVHRCDAPADHATTHSRMPCTRCRRTLEDHTTLKGSFYSREPRSSAAGG